jgi:hypothetical protein
MQNVEEVHDTELKFPAGSMLRYGDHEREPVSETVVDLGKVAKMPPISATRRAILVGTLHRECAIELWFSAFPLLDSRDFFLNIIPLTGCACDDNEIYGIQAEVIDPSGIVDIQSLISFFHSIVEFALT